LTRRRVGENRPLIRGVGEQLRQEGEASKQHAQNQTTAVTILDAGRVHDTVQHQAPERVDEYMALLALIFLPAS
jgi:hypothetical protein